jgi:hypothetical protein
MPVAGPQATLSYQTWTTSIIASLPPKHTASRHLCFRCLPPSASKVKTRIRWKDVREDSHGGSSQVLIPMPVKFDSTSALNRLYILDVIMTRSTAGQVHRYDSTPRRSPLKSEPLNPCCCLAFCWLRTVNRRRCLTPVPDAQSLGLFLKAAAHWG